MFTICFYHQTMTFKSNYFLKKQKSQIFFFTTLNFFHFKYLLELRNILRMIEILNCIPPFSILLFLISNREYYYNISRNRFYVLVENGDIFKVGLIKFIWFIKFVPSPNNSRNSAWKRWERLLWIHAWIPTWFITGPRIEIIPVTPSVYTAL